MVACEARDQPLLLWPLLLPAPHALASLLLPKQPHLRAMKVLFPLPGTDIHLLLPGFTRFLLK